MKQMHDVIEKGLEDYLDGSASREFVGHLAGCPSCTEEVQHIQNVSGLLLVLRSDVPPAPSLGFDSRLMRNLRDRRARSFWTLFNVDPSFTRKIAFASLLSLAILGSYLATESGDSMEAADHTPEAVMANHDSSGSSEQRMDRMALTLASYQK